MSEDKGWLAPEDYVEPRCVLCGDPYGTAPEIKPIPQGRVIRRMDELMSRRDYKGAERHLKYWLEEAILGNDKRGELLVRNELIGHFRKTLNKEGAFESIDAALRLIDELDYSQTVTAGTTFVNAATAYNSFGENKKAYELFKRAKELYEFQSSTSPSLLGGLYNNMALTCVALGKFSEAHTLYEKALEIMAGVENGELEQAITYLNIADALCAEKGQENVEKEVFALLDNACDCLDSPNVRRDGYYAFVCEKCAPGFSFYGYFLYAQELTKRSESIYERP